MGERVLDYADVTAGDAGPAISHPLTRTDLVMYAGASGDFNPMHHDEIAAQQAGLPSVFGHGMFTAGLLATAVTNYVGIGNLKSYRVRFTKQTWPGEVLTTSVTVREKRPGNEVVLDCSVVNENGETKIQGEAVAVLRVTDDARFDLPTTDLETQPFWDGLKEGKFLLRHCNACGRDHYYPRPFCPTCWSDDVVVEGGVGPRHALHVLGRARERPAAVQRACAVRRRDRRARRRPAGDDQHRGRARSTSCAPTCRSSSTTRRSPTTSRSRSSAPRADR